MAQQYGRSAGVTVQMAGPFGNAGAAAKLAEITLPVSSWKGATSPYSQVVEIEGVSINSMVNLQLSVEQIQIFSQKDIAFSTENDGGEVTVYAFGEKPDADYTIQATIMEVTT